MKNWSTAAENFKAQAKNAETVVKRYQKSVDAQKKYANDWTVLAKGIIKLQESFKAAEKKGDEKKMEKIKKDAERLDAKAKKIEQEVQKRIPVINTAMKKAATQVQTSVKGVVDPLQKEAA
jgi:DNA repair ATPase RecN